MTAAVLIKDEAGRQHALDRIAHLDLDGKRWELTVERHRERRSQRQSRLYFSWVDEVVDHVSDTTGYERAEVHAFFKSNFLEPGRDIQIKGLTARADVTTTTLNTAEMSAYMDTIYRWVSAEFGFALRLPPVMVEEGYDGPPKQANTEDDWYAVAKDIQDQVLEATSRGRLEEIEALYTHDFDGLRDHAPAYYDRIMRAMERQGEELNRQDPAADSARGDPAPHTVEAG